MQHIAILHVLLKEPRALLEQDVPQVENRQIPFVLDGVECRGTENKLGDCRRSSFVQQCSHLGANHHNAGAFCTNIRGLYTDNFVNCVHKQHMFLQYAMTKAKQ